MTTWTVLATGPSLRRLRPESLYANGPIVAINNAILSPLPCDFWCCLDNTSRFQHIWGSLTPEQRKQLGCVWCRESQAIAWRDAHIRCWPFPDTEELFRAQNLPRVRLRATSMFHLTLYATVSRCIGLGATSVDVFGCDMAGVEHSHGPDPINRSESSWHARWKDEREGMVAAMKEWEQCGVPVVLRQPPD